MTPSTSHYLPRIIITSGEPAGIGPDLCIQLSAIDIPAQLLVLGNKDLLAERARALNIDVDIETVDSLESTLNNHSAGKLQVYSIPMATQVTPGKLLKQNAAYVIRQLDLAIEACVSKKFSAMVTGPVHKGILNDAGVVFTGHTEYLAEKTDTALPVMLLQTEGLRVALATTHLPLREVPDRLSTDLLVNIINIIHHDLVNRYGITKPSIIVCGLNPHAGEGGYLGDEEIRIIEPAINQCQKKGIQVTGPLSADTIFSQDNLRHADVFLAMYHDQGLPVIKYRGFGKTVNVTLGLPVIRTSVDHGTALSLAATGKADAGSFIEALKAAIELSKPTS